MIILAAAILLLIIGIGAIGWSGIKRLGDEPYCARCGFELTGVPGAERCPECGTFLSLPTSRIIGKRNQKAFRLGLILILISLPFFLLRYSQTMSTSDQHKPLWWLRAEYTFVHQNDWRYFNELKRRLDASPQTSGRERTIAASVLDQADALGGQPNIRDAVMSAYRHVSLADRSEHIGKLVQEWVDDGLNTRSLAFMNLNSYLQQASSELAIEPLVQHLEKQRETLTTDSTRFDIRQAIDMELIGLVQIWWKANGPGAPLDFQDRFRGEPIGIYTISPTVVSKGEEFSLRIGPRFAGLAYELPGWSHARINEMRLNGNRLEIEYPIGFSYLLSNPAGARPVLLDLSALGTGTYDMEIDAQVIGFEGPLPSDAEWEGADTDTIRRTLRVMPTVNDMKEYWASDEVRKAAHDSICVQRLRIVPVELDETIYKVWDLSISIFDSPVFLFHDTYIEQGDQTWKLDQIYIRETMSDTFETHTRFYATVERHQHHLDPPVIRVPMSGEPVMIRLVPNPDISYNMYESLWAHEIELGPFIPDEVTRER